MKQLLKYIIWTLIFGIGLSLISCSKGITPYQAANGKAKCGRFIK